MVLDREMTSSQAKLAVEEGSAVKSRKTKVITKYLVVIVVILALVTLSLVVATVIIASDRAGLTARLRSFSSNHDNSDCPPPEECLTPTCVKAAAELLDSMNPAADPCENFFEYACGGWTRKYIIPEYRSSFSSFSVLREQLQVTLKGLLEEPISSTDIESEIKVKKFYAACMNTEAIEAIDDAPLRDLQHDLGGWPVLGNQHGGRWNQSNFDFVWLLATLSGKYFNSMLIEPYVGIDDKNASSHVLEIDQAGLGLSSREYYLHREKHQKVQDAYLDLMIKVALLLNADPAVAERDMRAVMEFEINVANLTIPPAERRDSEALYNPTTLVGLEIDYPQLDWRRFFDMVLPNVSKPLGDDEMIINKEPEYVANILQLLIRTPQRTLANYMVWRITKFRIMNLSKRFEEVYNEFRAIIYGVSSTDARWRRCVDSINGAMDFATGRMYVRENFGGEAKNNTLRMIKYLKRAFKEMLNDNEWMDEETKRVAAEKCDAMQERVGYPDWLFDDERLNEEYETLEFQDNDHFGNVIRYLGWSANDNYEKLREEVDRDGWLIGPAVVNAYYRSNQIVFPAAILQPPFYHSDLPWYLNYGGIGMVIGHEITHGFDDRGRQYDKDGNLVQWWSNSSIEAFKGRAECIVDQYSGYVMPENEMNLNGQLTQGENIADNGGLKQALRAYQTFVEETGETPLKLPGLDHNQEQLFFLNFGQVWCSSFRPEGVTSRILSSAHSPGRYRTVGPSQNMPEFARVFGCKSTDYMVANNTCTVW